MDPTEINSISYAVTFTTGDEYNLLTCKKWNYKLNDLLFLFRKRFIDFMFTLEILDKELVETLIHYHGYVIVSYKNITYFQEFIRIWKSFGFIKIKQITDHDKWVTYILKHQKILDIGYTIETIMFLPDTVLQRNNNLLLKYIKKHSS